jgi:hypothetical protein
MIFNYAILLLFLINCANLKKNINFLTTMNDAIHHIIKIGRGYFCRKNNLHVFCTEIVFIYLEKKTKNYSFF